MGVSKNEFRWFSCWLYENGFPYIAESLQEHALYDILMESIKEPTGQDLKVKLSVLNILVFWERLSYLYCQMSYVRRDQEGVCHHIES